MKPRDSITGITPALLYQSIFDMREEIREMNDKLDRRYVRIEAFSPVRNIVYGMVGLILTAVMAGLLKTVLKV